jgi:DMSO/TMAO reductase YedYZ molybdopterin-dependent catalytic subunit
LTSSRVGRFIRPMKMKRRAFLASSSALALARRAAADAGEPAHELLRHVGAPQDLATPIEWFDRLITPTDVFFVRSHFGPPSLDRSRKVTVGGMVKAPLSLDVDALRSGFANTTVTAVLQCAGNGRALHAPRVPGVQWGHGAMGQATFTGVRLADVLAKAGADRAAGFVQISGADAPPKPTVPAFVRSIPMERALDPSTLIAWAMNGKDLDLAHGAPLRLVVPGWAGDHWIKWLTHVTVQKEEASGFFMQTAYKYPTEPVSPGASVPPEKMRSLTTFPVKSIIARPAEGGRAPVGPQTVAGCAFSGEAPIAKVEISIDGGKSWSAAKLTGEPAAGRWQVFEHRFEQKAPGRVTAMARATDKKGNVQPESAAWNPSGYFWNAWHRVTWEVTA